MAISKQGTSGAIYFLSTLVLDGFHEITANIPEERGWTLKKLT